MNTSASAAVRMRIFYRQRGAGPVPTINTDCLVVSIRQSQRIAESRTHHPNHQRWIDRPDDHAGLWCHRILARRQCSGHRRRSVIRLSGAIILRADRHRSAKPWIDVSDVRAGHAFGEIKDDCFYLIWAVAAGINAKIFMAWYGKPELIWMAIVARMATYHAAEDVKIVVLCLLLLCVIADQLAKRLYFHLSAKQSCDGSFRFQTHLEQSQKHHVFPFPTFWLIPVLCKWDWCACLALDYGQSATR